MSRTIEIDHNIYKVLLETFCEISLKNKLNEILFFGNESRLEKYNREIVEFEEKYGVPFKKFESMWDNDELINRHSYEIESDFIDWEMLEMEKKDLMKALSQIKKVNN